MEADLDEDGWLLAWIYRRSLMAAKTDARGLRRKNIKALRLAIEQSERKAKEAARVAKLKQEQDRVVRRMKGLIVLEDSCTFSSDDQDPPPATDAYSCVGERTCPVTN